ncbi:hypothetical protein NIT7321_01687 [Phaeobacter italicus]|uniref:Uncharacterized protein n=1 Tax=Phaeobacter italicus TaxID=481446 RepID=A0A0H5D1E5_9RHOB|nr:hypothetical protein NIT7321_01687 [Phaeobacter italicus]
MGLHGGRARQQIPQHSHVARRGGDTDARVRAQSQRKLQHVPTVLPAFPFRQFIRPGGVKLRAAQGLRVVGRKGLGGGTIGPDQPPLRRFPLGAAIWWGTGENATVALHHDIAHLIVGFPKQGDTPGAACGQGCWPFGQRTHPFGAGAGLSCAASTKDDPAAPVSLRGALMRQGPQIKDIRHRGKIMVAQPVQKGLLR